MHDCSVATWGELSETRGPHPCGLLLCYSGKFIVPLMLKVPAAAAAPVPGWPPPMLILYWPSAMIGSPASRDHAQVARLQIEVDRLRCAGFEMDALEPAQGAQRSALDIREAEVELGYFVAG